MRILKNENQLFDQGIRVTSRRCLERILRFAELQGELSRTMRMVAAEDLTSAFSWASVPIVPSFWNNVQHYIVTGQVSLNHPEAFRNLVMSWRETFFRVFCLNFPEEDDPELDE